MLLLDSNHLDALIFDHERGDRLAARLVNATEHEVVTTILNVQEKLEGWLSKINRSGEPLRSQVHQYDEFRRWIYFFAKWNILPFDEEAVIQFERLTASGIRGKTKDLKI